MNVQTLIAESTPFLDWVVRWKNALAPVPASAPGFRLELKFKAQNLSRLKSAWAFSPEIHFRVKIRPKTEMHPPQTEMHPQCAAILILKQDAFALGKKRIKVVHISTRDRFQWQIYWISTTWWQSLTIG